MGFPQFARLWLLVLVAGFWVFAASLAKLAAGRVTLRATLIAGAVLFLFPGTIVTLNTGQADVLLWALVGWALAAGAFSGPGFALVALVKVFTVWPLAAALLRPERMRVAAGAALTVVAVTAIAMLALGPSRFVGESVVWVRDVLPTLGAGQWIEGSGVVELFGRDNLYVQLVPANLSLSSAPFRIAREFGWVSWTEPPTVVRLWLLASSIAAPLAAAWLLRRRSAVAHYGGTLAAALLFAPIFRPSYLALLLPVVAVWWRNRSARAEASQAPAARQGLLVEH